MVQAARITAPKIPYVKSDMFLTAVALSLADQASRETDPRKRSKFENAALRAWQQARRAA
jgi:hypothetical protein